MANNRELSQFASSVSSDSGRVGINTDTFSDARDSLIVAPPSGQTDVFFTIKTLSTNGNTRLQFADPDDTNVGDISYTHSNNAMVFKTADTERLSIDSSGNLTAVNTSSGGATTLKVGANATSGVNNGTVIINNGGTGDGALQFDYENSAARAKIYVYRSEQELRFDTAGSEKLRLTSAGRMLLGTPTVPTGLVLGNSLTAASSTGAEVVAFRSDTSVAVGDKCGAFVIGNSDTDGVEDHFVGMWGKVASTNGSMNLHFAAGRSSYEGDTPDVTIKSGGDVGINTTSNNDGAHFQHYQSEVRHQSFQSNNGDLAIVTDNNSNPAAYIKGTGTADLLKVVDNSTTVFLVEDGGYVTKPNTPAFSVRRNSVQDIAHNTNTKVQWNTEIFDVGGNFDSSTNYRFTAPVAGKYLFMGHLYIYSTMQVEAKIYKNGSIYKRFSGPLGSGGNDNPNGMDFMDIIDLSVNDFIEIFGYHYRSGDSSSVSIYGGNEKETSFVGYLLG